jgi:hypothetical protein
VYQLLPLKLNGEAESYFAQKGGSNETSQKIKSLMKKLIALYWLTRNKLCGIEKVEKEKERIQDNWLQLLEI